MKRQQLVVVAAILLVMNLLMPGVAMASAPATPTQESPANGATDLPPQVTVRWTRSNPGETYRVQISQDATFTALVTDAQVTDAMTWTVFGLTKDTVYYWRVNASAGGQTSDWSPVWNFRVTNRAIPAVPTLVSPANGATGVPASPTLVWNGVEGADAYDFQIAAEPSFGAAIVQWYGYVGTSTTVPATDLQEAYTNHFFWRVRSKNPAGASAWSETWEFRTAP